MKQTDAEYRAILCKADLPTTGLPEGSIEDARWQMGSNNWYVQIASRWYWFDVTIGIICLIDEGEAT